MRCRCLPDAITAACRRRQQQRLFAHDAGAREYYAAMRCAISASRLKMMMLYQQPAQPLAAYISIMREEMISRAAKRRLTSRLYLQRFCLYRQRKAPHHLYQAAARARAPIRSYAAAGKAMPDCWQERWMIGHLAAEQPPRPSPRCRPADAVGFSTCRQAYARPYRERASQATWPDTALCADMGIH